jgi:hypothetical protein
VPGTLWLCLALLAASPAAAEERLEYRWKLDGFVGAVAGLFFPSKGEGSLSRETLPNGRWKSELLITSEARDGEFFRYGAELEPASLTTVRAWSASHWRGKSKAKESAVEAAGVIDIVSGIQVLRQDPPALPRPMEIWSDGRLYPVLVVPHGTGRRTLEGREVAVRHYVIRGIERPGRKLWKGGLELWLADDAAATPVEIVVTRSAARVRLELVEPGGGS